MMSKKIKAQTLLEYLMIVVAITSVLIVMGPYLKRGIQSVIKVTADQLQPQWKSEQRLDPRVGYLVDTFSVEKSKLYKERTEGMGGPEYSYGVRPKESLWPKPDSKYTWSQEFSNSLQNLGESPRFD